jgi:hypothetical protein
MHSSVSLLGGMLCLEPYSAEGSGRTRTVFSRARPAAAGSSRGARPRGWEGECSVCWRQAVQRVGAIQQQQAKEPATQPAVVAEGRSAISSISSSSSRQLQQQQQQQQQGSSSSAAAAGTGCASRLWLLQRRLISVYSY